MAALNPEPGLDTRALQPLLKVHKVTQREMLQILRDSLDDVNKELQKLRRRTDIGSRIRADQLQQAKSAIFRRMSQSWRDIGDAIRAARYESASAAADSIAVYDKMLFGAAGADTANRLLEAMRAEARNNVDLGRLRSEKSAIELSQQVYKTEALSRGWIDKKLNAMLSRGTTAREIAGAVRTFISPSVSGGMSYAAMRLGRTEINNVFHARQNAIMFDEPWVVATDWHLSQSHPRQDKCDALATDSSFNGKSGQYPPGEAPLRPHPQCFCYLTPVNVSDRDFLRRLKSGQYDQFMAKHGM